MNPRLSIPEDPIDRLRSIYETLEKDRRWWRGSMRLRYAAMAAICTEGSPASIAEGIRSVDRGIKDASPWNMDVGSHIRFIIGSILYQNGDSARGFVREVECVRKMFRAEKLHRALAMEMMAVLVLRIQSGGSSISRQTIRRFREIYNEMKQHHRWLTGPDDFPACAILTGQEGTPRVIGEKTEEIYSELRASKFPGGNPLQTAANLLFLADGTPQQLADKMSHLKSEFRNRKVRISQMNFDELAILAFLNQPAEKVVSDVVANREELKKVRPRFDSGTLFNASVGVTFVKFFETGVNMVSVNQAKTVIDGSCGGRSCCGSGRGHLNRSR